MEDFIVDWYIKKYGIHPDLAMCAEFGWDPIRYANGDYDDDCEEE